MSDEISRDLFHCCALTAWVHVAVETGQQPPDSERVRRLAYQLYEEELGREHWHRGRCRGGAGST